MNFMHEHINFYKTSEQKSSDIDLKYCPISCTATNLTVGSHYGTWMIKLAITWPVGFSNGASADCFTQSIGKDGCFIARRIFCQENI